MLEIFPDKKGYIPDRNDKMPVKKDQLISSGVARISLPGTGHTVCYVIADLGERFFKREGDTPSPLKIFEKLGVLICNLVPHMLPLKQNFLLKVFKYFRY